MSLIFRTIQLILILLTVTSPWEQLQSLECKSNAQIYGVDISTDGKTLAATWNLHQIRLWTIATGVNIHTFNYTPDAQFFSISFSPYGDEIAAAGTVGIIVWRILDGRLLTILPIVTEDTSEKPVFSPDEQRLIVSTHHGATLWNLRSGLLENRFPLEKNYASDFVPLVSPDFTDLLLWREATNGAPGLWEVWKVNDGKLFTSFTFLNPSFLPNSNQLIATDNEGLVIWDNINRKIMHFPHQGLFSSWKLSPNGQFILTQEGIANNELVLWSSDPWIELRRINPVLTLDTGETGQLNNYYFTSDSKQFISLTDVNTENTSFDIVHIWKTQPNELMAKFNTINHIYHVSFPVNSNIIVLTSIDKLESYDLNIGIKLHQFC